MNKDKLLNFLVKNLNEGLQDQVFSKKLLKETYPSGELTDEKINDWAADLTATTGYTISFDFLKNLISSF